MTPGLFLGGWLFGAAIIAGVLAAKGEEADIGVLLWPLVLGTIAGMAVLLSPIGLACWLGERWHDRRHPGGPTP